eukprot:Lithocolla_globosa_v1_NODE_2963_length_1811_cov_4.533030.p1 type:complete len:232 gc:universal NODE_2963_length_1811_cov_4.533030:796-1491(+)
MTALRPLGGGAPYGSDVRWRVVSKWQNGITNRQIMRDLDVGKTFVNKIKRLYRRFGDVWDPFAKSKGVKPCLSSATMEFLSDLMTETPDLLLDEIQLEVEAFAGFEVDRSTVWRALKKIGITWKKLTRVASERNELLVAHFLCRIAKYHVRHIVWFDETSKDNRTLLRKYGWAASSICASSPSPWNTFYTRGDNLHGRTPLSSSYLPRWTQIKRSTRICSRYHNPKYACTR